MKKKKIKRILKEQIRILDEKIRDTERNSGDFNMGYINGMYMGRFRLIDVYQKINKKDHGC